MPQLPGEHPLADQARRALAVLAEKGGFTVREVHEVGDLARLSKLFSEVWSGSDPLVTTELMRAMSHAGNHVASASSGGELLGGILAFTGLEETDVILHSHILGILPNAQGRNLGFALKQHQRLWALERGITKVTWTFDPLVRKNAYFNIAKLGARASAYYERFYGLMSDRVNAGDESDRLFITWQLTDKRAVAASESKHQTVDADDLIEQGAAPILDEVNGAPEVKESSGDVLLCRVPDDIVSMRESDLDLALKWRRALRSTLGAALSEGYVVEDFARSGWYVLRRA